MASLHGDDLRLRAAVESSPNGLLVIDRDGTIVFVNREIERLFGDSRDELLGSSVERDPAYFDPLMTDYAMPGMTGMQLAHQVTALRAELPVMLLTGSGGFSARRTRDRRKSPGPRQAGQRRRARSVGPGNARGRCAMI